MSGLDEHARNLLRQPKLQPQKSRRQQPGKQATSMGTRAMKESGRRPVSPVKAQIMHGYI